MQNEHKANVLAAFTHNITMLFPKTSASMLAVLSETPDNPYHNAHHCMSVANTLLSICMGMPIRVELNPCYRLKHKPSKAEVSQVFLAAAFHDYGHSGGLLKDAYNISVACELFTPRRVNKFVAINLCDIQGLMIDLGLHRLDYVYKALDFIVECIKDTKFPYEAEPTSWWSGLLRDVDRLSCLLPDAHEQIYKGLFYEVTTGTRQEYLDFCWNQVSFLQLFKAYSTSNIKQLLEPAIYSAKLIAAKATIESENAV